MSLLISGGQMKLGGDGNYLETFGGQAGEAWIAGLRDISEWGDGGGLEDGLGSGESEAGMEIDGGIFNAIPVGIVSGDRDSTGTAGAYECFTADGWSGLE